MKLNSELFYKNQRFLISINEISIYCAFLAYITRKNFESIPNFHWGDRIFFEFDVIYDIRFSKGEFKHPFLSRNIEAYYGCMFNHPTRVSLNFNLREAKFTKLDILCTKFKKQFLFLHF